jgi:hypothetical protein
MLQAAQQHGLQLGPSSGGHREVGGRGHGGEPKGGGLAGQLLLWLFAAVPARILRSQSRNL